MTPIHLTKSLLFSLERSEYYLSRLPCENFVKIFVIQELKNKILLNADLGNYESCIKEINHIDGGSAYFSEVGAAALINKYQDFGSYTISQFNDINCDNLNILRLNKITLEYRFDPLVVSAATKDLDSIKISEFKDNLDGYDYKGTFIHSSSSCRQREANKYLLSYLKEDPKYPSDSMCGCYIIMFNNPRYFYIGYSSNIKKRLHSHFLKIREIINRLRFFDQNSLNNAVFNYKSSTDILPFFLASCLANNILIHCKMAPIYLYTNLYSKFLFIYPDYKLSTLRAWGPGGHEGRVNI